jgi:hypothetical protein
MGIIPFNFDTRNPFSSGKNPRVGSETNHAPYFETWKVKVAEKKPKKGFFLGRLYLGQVANLLG